MNDIIITDMEADLGMVNNPKINSEQLAELISLAKRNDSSFMIFFYEWYPWFSYRLNNLALTPLNQAELELCALSRLMFSTKEIAFYRNQSIRAIENRKYRIRKKFALHPKVDFVVWMSNLK